MSCRSELPDSLCRKCAICCNGMLFRDVELDSRETIRRLAQKGFASRLHNGKRVLPQPCPALVGKDCRCYSVRPDYCRRFECGLFKEVASGVRTLRGARRVVQATLRQAQKVETLLKALGEIDSSLPLRTRFQRLTRRIERDGVSPDTAILYGTLAEAMHELNLALADNFYPGNPCAPASP